MSELSDESAKLADDDPIDLLLGAEPSGGDGDGLDDIFGAAPDELRSAQAEHDGSVVDDLLGLRREVGGVKLRPSSLATVAILNKLNSPFLSGGGFEDFDQPLLQIAEYVVTHDTRHNYREVAVMLMSPVVLMGACLEWLDGADIPDATTMVKAIAKDIERAKRTQAKSAKPGDPPKG